MKRLLIVSAVSVALTAQARAQFTPIESFTKPRMASLYEKARGVVLAPEMGTCRGYASQARLDEMDGAMMSAAIHELVADRSVDQLVFAFQKPVERAPEAVRKAMGTMRLDQSEETPEVRRSLKKLAALAEDVIAVLREDESIRIERGIAVYSDGTRIDEVSYLAVIDEETRDVFLLGNGSCRFPWPGQASAPEAGGWLGAAS